MYKFKKMGIKTVNLKGRRKEGKLFYPKRKLLPLTIFYPKLIIFRWEVIC